ncbi:MAG: tRNA (adenosine(37)-N6)-threonylcarbamoyltransferase complex dimerization subunit type 1 TsaB [Chloroflexi bacterium]|nr:tRNA (adenosine(37)-N6)-threonylcarbamoyltransferase complex dimerization subunit type 1 TsaB [Chloroflexota bacterium]
MIILAIDSSTDLAGIALAEEDRIIAELTWPCGQNQTAELAPNILFLLKQAKTTVDSLGAVAVARGPGSFNGLRAGISLAKGLAYGRQIPMVAAGTLEIEAYQHSLTGMAICPVLDAGRGEIATALFSSEGDDWKQLADEHITTVDDLVRSVRSRTVFCGQLSKYGAALRVLGELAVFPPPPAWPRRAGYLAHLGWRKVQQGLADNPATLQPLYLRQPPITQPKTAFRAGSP